MRISAAAAASSGCGDKVAIAQMPIFSLSMERILLHTTLLIRFFLPGRNYMFSNLVGRHRQATDTTAMLARLISAIEPNDRWEEGARRHIQFVTARRPKPWILWTIVGGVINQIPRRRRDGDHGAWRKMSSM